MKEKQSILEDIKPLVAQIQQLQQQAYEIYKPQVHALIKNKTTDESYIQQLLDGMLDFCGGPNILLLYKKLCRYYWEINPQTTAQYVNDYREIWDNEKTENDSN